MITRAYLFDPARQCWLHFSDPVDQIGASDPADVMSVLEEIEARVEREGLHAAGVISYEAASGFDSACTTHPADNFPLLQFALFPPPQPVRLPTANRIRPLAWSPGISPEQFRQQVAVIHAAIARGDTYQVNYTFPLRSDFRNQDPWELFLQMVGNQQTRHGGYLECGDWVICSASPELFFERSGETLTMRPMKGTMRRGRTFEEDRTLARQLESSAKDRAENIMILDMVRNDLGRLADTGSVITESLCQVEKYPTLWQMTSTVKARYQGGLAEIFRALFPCASITGAPKAKTMEIIRQLERAPRRIYTGSFGWVAPDRRAHFSVAIRTALLDRRQQQLEYGVGAGITWDSEPTAEYQECLTKARLFAATTTDFELIETLRWTPTHGYFLRREHRQRLFDSATYFDIPFAETEFDTTLERLAETLPAQPCRVRLLLTQSGSLRTEWTELHGPGTEPVRLQLASQPVDSDNPRLYHKTTDRQIYDDARSQRPDIDDVILWNQDGELTETTIANLVLDLDGDLVTPPLSAGLLPGTYRTFLLQRGCLSERRLTPEDLNKAHRIYLINAVRKWRRAIIVS